MQKMNEIDKHSRYDIEPEKEMMLQSGICTSIVIHPADTYPAHTS